MKSNDMTHTASLPWWSPQRVLWQQHWQRWRWWCLEVGFIFGLSIEISDKKHWFRPHLVHSQWRPTNWRCFASRRPSGTPRASSCAACAAPPPSLSPSPPSGGSPPPFASTPPSSRDQSVGQQNIFLKLNSTSAADKLRSTSLMRLDETSSLHTWHD